MKGSMGFMRKIFGVLLICCLISIIGINGINAQTFTLGFSRKLTYDIYFGRGDNVSSVIKNIEILRFDTIGGKNFLVIKSRGFKLKEEEGFIRFESVTTILPNREFSVKNIDNINIY